MDQKIKSNIYVGFIAGSIQTVITYPLKTIIKYQYSTGNNIIYSVTRLYRDPDKFRFYRGLGLSVLKTSFGRMGETGIYTYFNSKDLSHSEKTSLIAFTSTSWKSVLIPIDTITNIYQVKGLEGKNLIKDKIKN